MNLGYSEDQRMLRSSVDRFLEAIGPVSEIRKVRDLGLTQGYVDETWAQMVEQGWPAVAASDVHGGLELGQAGLGLIAEALGRTLTPSPFEATVMMGVTLLERIAKSEEHLAVLQGAVAGELRLALAVQEGDHFDPSAIAARVTRDDDGLRLTGHKTFVMDGGIADRLVVIARLGESGGPANPLCVVLVDPKSSGVSVENLISLDSRQVANLSFSDVRLPATAMISEIGENGAFARLEDVVAAQIAAELLGISLEVFRITCEFLRTREQFGVKIGTFQALQHRSAALFVDLECARGLVRAALAALDEDDPVASAIASAAKAKLCRVSRSALAEAIQMHGGIGVTDELDLGLYLKRAAVLQHLFGDVNYHTDRFASIKGY